MSAALHNGDLEFAPVGQRDDQPLVVGHDARVVEGLNLQVLPIDLGAISPVAGDQLCQTVLQVGVSVTAA